MKNWGKRKGHARGNTYTDAVSVFVPHGFLSVERENGRICLTNTKANAFNIMTGKLRAKMPFRDLR
jgi:hypothetical protein